MLSLRYSIACSFEGYAIVEPGTTLRRKKNVLVIILRTI